MHAFEPSSRISKWHWLTAGVLGVLCVMALDVSTGRELSLSLFYLVPIGLVCLKVGGRSALLIAGLSAFAWAEAEVLNGYSYSHVAVPFWNAVVRLSFFVIFTGLLHSLRHALREQRSLARTDVLTGAVNRRSFLEVMSQELARSRRYARPFALVYFDLDHFKRVNDDLGHQAGDEVLRTVVHELKKNLRQTDTVARLGGDEFALLLPETPADAAESLIAKLRFRLLDAMKDRGWPVTFSIGLLNCDGNVPDEDALIRRVDQLMYEVKRNGRNSLRVDHTGREPEAEGTQTDLVFPRRAA